MWPLLMKIPCELEKNVYSAVVEWRRLYIISTMFIWHQLYTFGTCLVAQTVKESACYVGDLGLIPGWGRSPGGGHGNPLQYSCLENHYGQEPGRLRSTGLQRVGHDWATWHICNWVQICLHWFSARWICLSLRRGCWSLQLWWWRHLLVFLLVILLGFVSWSLLRTVNTFLGNWPLCH